ncbi:MAG: hypothetical protein N2C13_05020 [Chloroflexota bacterium]
MKVHMDRNHCQLSLAACESCFGGRILLKEFDMEGCVMKIEEEEDKENITFYIKDRDGEDKVLYVNADNWPDAYDSWFLMYEKQHTGENQTLAG